MARTSSTMLSLGTKAPEFILPDTENNSVSLSQVSNRKKGTLVFFICNHCPYVIHIASVLARVTADYMKQGIGVVGINSNDVENYPEDNPEKMKLEKKNRNYLFPYLFDESQTVAKAYQAACTPDFYLFDSQLNLVYRGQFDDSRPGNGIPVTGKDLNLAVQHLLANRPISAEQHPSLGCNIKWKD